MSSGDNTAVSSTTDKSTSVAAVSSLTGTSELLKKETRHDNEELRFIFDQYDLNKNGTVPYNIPYPTIPLYLPKYGEAFRTDDGPFALLFHSTARPFPAILHRRYHIP
jgi:hypothetical protein